MTKNTSFPAVLLLLVAATAVAQPGPGRGTRAAGFAPATVSAYVYDADLDVPVEYATVILYRLADSSQVTGTVTGADGRFRLQTRPGRYYLEVSFIGYQTRRVDEVQAAPGAKLDLGRIGLRQAVVAVEGAEVVAERPTMSFEIDKKVIDVGRMATARSGSAVDVLENVPSVQVDVEGNVSLRGSENFTVLVDNRPSVLDGSEALEQIPAATIDKIEIITNPSAKYDPEGVAGIINVLLKKEKSSGISGTASLNSGLYGSYGGEFLFSFRHGMANAFLGANYNRRSFPGSRSSESWTRSGDTTNWVTAEGESEGGGTFNGLRGGADLQFGGHDRTSIGGGWGGRDFGRGQIAEYREWTLPGLDTTVFLSDDWGGRGGSYWYASLDQVHTFGANGHDLAARAHYSVRDFGSDNLTELFDQDSVQTQGRRSVEKGPGRRLTLTLDYTQPARKNDKLEAGYSGRIRRSDEENETWVYNPGADSYEFQDEYSHNTLGRRSIHALYALYGGELGRLGFKTGLRGEYVDRSIELVGDTLEPFTLERWDLFPTVHFSFDLPAEQQVMASYTRRIHRPRSWYLEPYVTWRDAYNVNQGNPGLKPEYIDSYEAGYQLPFGQSRLTAEAFWRKTHNKVERVESPFPGYPNVILHTVANVGSDRSVGGELMLDFRPVKFWNANLTAEAYDYLVEGVLNGRSFAETSFNWGGRLSNNFYLPTNTMLQVNTRYRSPSVSAQGRHDGFVTADLAIRQQFFKRELTITLQARDALNTGRHQHTSGGGPDDDFYTRFEFDRKWPSLRLNLTWNFNNYRPERRRRGVEEDNGEFEEEGEM
ncbi:MAG: TonB-dependent receptor [candidate division WOR-3 bacterium]|nr:MAG: TonB-dependent receptor [candidate division WOR-3 bacterium]